MDANAIVVIGSAAPLPPLLPWRGAFVIPDAIPGIPGGDERRIWTPAFGTYRGTPWQQRIIDVYHQHKYTHFVYDCAGWIYHQDYGYLPDSVSGVRSDLILLRQNGLIPVVAACDDQDGGSLTPWASFTANADLIPIAFPMWEMNGPLGNATYNGDGTFSGRIVDCIANTRKAAPNTKLYLHFTAGHGSIGEPEGEGWSFCKNAYNVAGLLSQDAGYDRNSETGDPIGTGEGLQDTATRLPRYAPGLENVRFEQVTYPVYNHWTGWDEAHQISYGNELGQLAPATVGFCDGGN